MNESEVDALVTAAVRHGVRVEANQRPRKLDDETLAEAYRHHLSGLNLRCLGRHYGVSSTYLSAAFGRKGWRVEGNGAGIQIQEIAMSPGIQTITKADLPLTVIDPDIRCPVCGRPMVITAIDEAAIEDGRVPAGGLRTGCSKEPPTESAKWDGWYNRHLGAATTAEWQAVRWQIYQWFDNWFRYRHVAPEVIAKKRRMKWRRAA